MEYIPKARHLKIKSETKIIKSKIVMTKSFLFKNIKPKSYTARSFLSAVHIYIHTPIHKTQLRDRAITQYYNGTKTSNGDRL